jgi:hypothetical protein
MPFTGFPYDEYLTERWDQIDRPYKAYLFTMPFEITSEQRVEIHAKLVAENAVAIWTYAPGYLSENGPSFDACRDLTGFSLERRTGPGHVHVQVSSLEQVAGLASDLLPNDAVDYGTRHDPDFFERGCGWWAWPRDHRFADIFSVRADSVSEVEVLGRLDDRSIGLAMCRHEGFTSIYSAAPLLNAHLLRAIFLRAEAHCYAPDGDVVFANDRYVTMHATGDGPRRIRLPYRANWVDAMSNKAVASGVSEISIDCHPGESRILHVSKL